MKPRPRGVTPHNDLSNAVTPIVIPTKHIVRLNPQSVVKPLNLDDVELSTDAKDCFFKSLNLEECGLTVEPSISIKVKIVDYNGTKITSEDSAALRLLVLARKDFIYLVKGTSFVDKMIIEKGSLESAFFDKETADFVLVLAKNYGYWCIELRDSYRRLFEFIVNSDREWGFNYKVVDLTKLKVIQHRELQKHENLHKDPIMVVRTCDSIEKPTAEEDEVLRNGLPSALVPSKEKSIISKERPVPDKEKNVTSTDIAVSPVFARHVSNPRVTRSFKLSQQLLPNNTVDIDLSDDSLDQEMEEVQDVHENPAPFSPPLRYVINGQKFTITANDFKTLYNSSWVNDTLIDFFVAFEIERAITDFHSFKRSQIYAFNSFFHAKLVSTPNEDELPPYYENIRKWLEKLDLMSYQYIVIPVMENAHWFCLVIKNLPALLAFTQAQEDLECSNTVCDSNEVIISPSVNSPSSVTSKQPDFTMAEIFVLDSLRLTHPRLTEPLKMVLKEHCREKHGVTINTDHIKVRNLRVAKQRNLSDCGVHVIYNLKKWLSLPEICEKSWRKPGNAFRSLKDERTSMRKWCIDTLLNLHSEQPLTKEDGEQGDGEDIHSDDDIEVISFHEPNLSQSTAQNGFPQEEPAHETNELDLGAAKNGESVHNTSSLESKAPETKNLAVESESGSLFAKLILDSFVEESEKDHSIVRSSAASNSSLPLDSTDDYETAGEQTRSQFYIKTLDPRAAEKKSSSGLPTFIQIEHPQVRKECLRLKLSKDTVLFLNKVFFNHDRVLPDHQLNSLLKKVRSFEECIDRNDSRNLESVKNEFLLMTKEPVAPKDVPFVIEEEAEEQQDLNRSVNDLKITADEDTSSQELQTTKTHSSESVQFKAHIQIVKSPHLNSSENIGSDVEVIESRKMSPRIRRTRSEFKTRHHEENLKKMPVEILPDSDEEVTTVLMSKGGPNDWSSPKRRRLDRSQ